MSEFNISEDAGCGDEDVKQQQTLDFDAIKETLLSGKKTGLTLELLYEAFNQIKLDPEITISEACYNAMWDWDC